MSNEVKNDTPYWVKAGQSGPFTTHRGTLFVRSTDYQESIKLDDLTSAPSMKEIMSNQDLDPDYLAYTAIKYTARRMLPYGRWTTADNRIVIFNREYQPIFERIGEVNNFIKHDEIIENISKVEYFYDHSNSPISYLVRKFKDRKLDMSQVAKCKKSLLICLNIINEFEPKPSSKNHVSTWRTLAR